jgi:hypothetical protein
MQFYHLLITGGKSSFHPAEGRSPFGDDGSPGEHVTAGGALALAEEGEGAENVVDLA